MDRLKIIIVSALSLLICTGSPVLSSCEMPNTPFSLEIFGTYTKGLGSNQFEASFKFTEIKSTKLSHQLTFIDSKYKTLVIKVNHLPSTSALKKGQSYTIKYVAGVGMGMSGLKTLTVLDKMGPVFSLSNMPKNAHIGLTSIQKEYTNCPTVGGFKPALATLKSTSGAVMYGKGGQTGQIKINGITYNVKVVSSKVRQPFKGISVDGPTNVVAYILSRK